MAKTFKGLYNAYDFAFGINPDSGGTLQVVSGSTVSGTYTITCSPADLRAADGNKIDLTLANLGPITIGGDSGIETVTPSAVSLNGLNQLLITATFTNAHGTGAQVRSGSLGLQEAVNYVHSKGGGVVEVDGQWVLAGGVNATITGVKGWTNVAIVDARGTVSGSAFSYHAASNGANLTVTTVSWY